MKIMISGGGTGGHIYPALALLDTLKQRHPNLEVLYIGTENGLEADLVPRAGVPFKSIRIAGLKRSLSLDNVKTAYWFVQSVLTLRKEMKTFRPDVVIGTGGFVSGPVVFTAQQLGIPTILHEQNSIPGLTNKFLSKKADRVALSFAGSESQFPDANVRVIGNPRGSEVLKTTVNEAAVRAKYDIDERPIVLIYGGSRGAEAINRAVIEAIPELATEPVNVLYVTGNVHYDNVVAKAPKADNVHVLPYVYDMPELLACASLVVSRAGASTISELTALGLASILIPSPYVTADHQTKNASALVESGAAELIKEGDLSGETLVRSIRHVLAHHDEMAAASKRLGFPHAAESLADLVEEVRA
ncbi:MULTISPECIES: undecaprenyldiphospho-muramoylpentapeptide beta-N-acetylglucosaminyltransferase [Exiguobacterium]|uniref:undecaprenyldiphospho-muramoylpentapeptide beta-N-acetylglucosaminyltransferase n=1 Tax=Exiguobacterium TaxID=33986 RepID=UPI001BEA08BD|nr:MULTISPECIES: undecaprenyldiphospho-muramoylpentapeptide beta-N-acetylglucosaminyltransferase [Exiguobacterium]MCT4776298.1 undecaprenyldiphospho-muramoylpentapeptide beta-N-acetylglucosaminyltransferase [Exiguobacterium aquaticum]MCT4789015.1 undecaprenyldiphospho-muramoylpentapeptide beta-N-acetylglucosaminyltransferase [Exiguobacterium mexicanum]